MQYDEILITLEGSTNKMIFFCSNGTDIRNSTVVCDGSQVPPTRPSDNSNKKLVNTTMVHLWNDTDREKHNYSEKHLSECSTVHQKSHMDWTCGICVLLKSSHASNY